MYRITLTLITSLCFSVSAWSQVDAGKKIFEDNCTACHSIGGGKIVGPDLQGVTERRKSDWIKKFVTNSQALIAAGDAEAKAVFEENGQIPMPSHAHLKDADLNALIDYFKSTSAVPEPVVAEAPKAVEPTETPSSGSSVPGYFYIFFVIIGAIAICFLIIIYQLLNLIKKFK